MLSIFIFLVGLFILFKGGFRLAGRTISFAQSRSIAFMLMAPFALAICINTVMLFNFAMNNPDVFMSMANEDGTPNMNSEAFVSVVNSMASTGGMIEMIGVIVAVVFAGITIYNAPKGVPLTVPQPQSRQGSSMPPIPPKAPDIMTVAEAAAYMRLSESEVLALIDEGRLGAAKIGSSFRIARIAIDDFMGLT